MTEPLPDQPHFKRAINLFDAIMLVTGSMIGSGIFIVSADIARQVGSAGWLLVVWLVTGFITLAGAISYGELAAMFPKVGGQYVYLREAFGRLTAFLYGWTLFLVIQTGVIAAVAVAFAKFTGVLQPWFSVRNVLFRFGTFEFSSVQLLAIGLIVAITALNAQGVRTGKLIQNVLSSTKLIALALLIVFGVALGLNHEAIAANFHDLWSATRYAPSGTGLLPVAISGPALLIAIGMAMTGSLFSSDSWNNIGFAGEEIQNPERTLVRSMAIGTAIVTALYILINVVYLLVLPLAGSPTATTVAGRGIMYAQDDRVGHRRSRIGAGAGRGLRAGRAHHAQHLRGQQTASSFPGPALISPWPKTAFFSPAWPASTGPAYRAGRCGRSASGPVCSASAAPTGNCSIT